MSTGAAEVRKDKPKNKSGITSSINNVLKGKGKKVPPTIMDNASRTRRSPTALRPVPVGVARSVRASLSPPQSLPSSSRARQTNPPSAIKRLPTTVRKPVRHQMWQSAAPAPAQPKPSQSTSTFLAPGSHATFLTSQSEDTDTESGRDSGLASDPLLDHSFRVISMPQPEDIEDSAYCCTTANACGRQPLPYMYKYPGLLPQPKAMAIVRSESGTYESIKRMLSTGLDCTDRVFVLTPWGNYVVFSLPSDSGSHLFIFDGCTCDMNRFRYLNLNEGTAGLMFFENTEDVIMYILKSRKTNVHQPKSATPQPEQQPLPQAQLMERRSPKAEIGFKQPIPNSKISYDEG